MYKHALAIASVTSLGAVAQGQSIVENFDTDLGSLVTLGGGSTQSVAVDGGQVVFDSTGNNGRTYVGTAAADNLTGDDFIATVQFTVANDADNNSLTHFFGVGSGAANGDGAGPGFGEPTNVNSVFVGIRGVNNGFLVYDGDDGTGAAVASLDANSLGNELTGLGFNNVIAGGNGFDAVPASGPVAGEVSTLQLTYLQGETASFALNGEELVTFDISDNGSLGSSIFFGSSDGSAFDSFTVTPVPEPASLALLGLGGLAVLGRRRRA